MAPKAHRPPASPASNEQAEEDKTKLHPALRGNSRVEQLLERAAGRKDDKEFQIAELEEWKICVNGLAATPNGIMFIRSMIQYSGYGEPPQLANPQLMVTNTIKAAFYLKWVRPFLSPNLRKEIEP